MLDAPQVPDIITKKRYAADWLREMVVSGDLAPGVRIRQQEVAQRLGISATPAREAILQLETEGYLESIPHVGVRVAEHVDDHRDEVTELRKLLEAQLARIAAEKISDSQVEQLHTLHQAFVDAVDRSDAREARRSNYHLHLFIWEVAGRVVTQQIVQGLWARVPWQSLDDVAVRGPLSVDEHAQLVGALSRRDPEGADLATRLHIDSAHDYLARPGSARGSEV